MDSRTTDLPGVLVLTPRTHPDDRGLFYEAWNSSRHAAAGAVGTWVQDNVSCSVRGVVRGLHFQNPHPQTKLVSVLEGEIFDVVVDLRTDSETFGRAAGFRLEAPMQIYVPVGFAHGFAVTSERAIVGYKVDAPWAPGAEAGIAWDDPDLALAWPTLDPILSPKDRALPRLRDLPKDRLFTARR
jgi:dTDP-4-dehydrorhamnose 3,5-epimerase